MRHGSITLNVRASAEFDVGTSFSLLPQQKIHYSHFCRKLIITIFWYVEGHFVYSFQPENAIVSSDNYWELLQLLKPQIKFSMSGKLSESVISYQDNSWPHIINKTTLCLQDPGFELLDNLPYRPDLVSRAFHLFGLLEEVLPGNILFRWRYEQWEIDWIWNWKVSLMKDFKCLLKCGVNMHMCRRGLCRKITHII